MKPEYRGKSNVSYQRSIWDSDIATKHGFSDPSFFIERYVGKEERGLLWCNSGLVPLRPSNLPLVGSRPAVSANFPSNSISGELPTYQYGKNELPSVKYRIAKKIQIGLTGKVPGNPASKGTTFVFGSSSNEVLLAENNFWSVLI